MIYCLTRRLKILVLSYFTLIEKDITLGSSETAQTHTDEPHIKKKKKKKKKKKAQKKQP